MVQYEIPRRTTFWSEYCNKRTNDRYNNRYRWQLFLEVPSRSSILVFTYIGFEEQEIVVGNQININLNMHEISTGLNEVVVVGYGSQKRASIVGSITTIEPQVLSQGTTRALSNNLAGNVAGVIAVQRSGEPGADGSNFWIRGISSFQGAGTSPLVLVDGIERTLDDEPC